MNFEAQTFLAVFMCGLTLAAWLLPTLAGTLRELWRRYAALGGAEATFIAALVLCAVYVGGTKPTNMQSQAQSGGTANTVMTGGAARMSVTGGGEPQRLSTNQYLAGFALVGAATHTVPWLDVPSNAVAHFPWTRHGVAEDTFWLPATNWSFVLGTNAVEGAHVSSSGTLSFGTPKGSPRAAELPDGDRLSFLAPLQASLGTVPPQGRFWHAATPSNSLLFTWQDVYAGRDTNSPVTFQAELFRNGDFTYRYAFTNAPALTNFVVGAQHSGGGETYAFNDTGKLANGLELRWRAFSLLDPSVSDHDGDGVSTYDEVMAHGTCPSMTDTDGDGLEDADELILGTGPLDPDTDGDLAADSTDPDPLTPDDPDTIMNCCSNTWLFHVHHALPTNGTCGASGFPYDYNLFAVTVTLNAPVIAPGAVLWIGGTPLVMRDPGSWTLWLDKETAKAVRLCAPRGVEVDYTVSADEYGFFIQPPPPEPVMPPLSHTATPEGTIAVPFFSIEPSYVCFHGAPVTFRAVGCA
ncbi:MAG TPA: hypothetical protein PL176_10790, partial [Kiritimatiellia bacterium]|nr:hypothetical protein [Kiritimatiellia bacterium]